MLPDAMIEEKMPGILLKSHLADVGSDTVIISDSHLIRATCWYFKRDNVYMLGEDELSYGLRYKDAEGRLLDPKAATRLIEEHRGNAVLIARAKHMANWRHELPVPVFEENSGPKGYYFLRY
jgi:4-amino-4-deoxy-L-arabinose transferase